MLRFFKHKTYKNNGFTLVEVLVSLSLFTIVVTIAVSSLLKLIDVNAKAQNMQDAMTNLTFAIDSMSREIRTGTSYHCSGNTDIGPNAQQDCTNGGNAISFVEGGSSLTGSEDKRIAYRYVSGASDEPGKIERKIEDGNWTDLTGSSVDIEEMFFVVSDSANYASSGDTTQPTVTMFISGNAGNREDLDSGFSVQTTITQRVIDVGGSN